MTPRHVLLVDDDPDFLKLLSLRLEREGYAVTGAASADEALACVLAKRPDVVLSDLRMAEKDGLDLLESIQKNHPALPVLIVTAHGTIPDAVAATQRGAFGFITKPVDRDDLLSQLDRALETFGTSVHADTSFLTRNAQVQTMLAQARLAAASDSSILIQGETGTGKEVLAKLIHRESTRASAPMITVNCAAIPGELMESELFGHVRGAFTGAATDRLGLIRAAHNGSLFLDEIGDMPRNLQSKLLRVLEDGLVRPVGSTQEHRADVRLISATHQDLGAAVRDGSFRTDLYYRLNIVKLTLPPLRERREDIALLAQHFLDAFCKGGERKVYAPEAMELLRRARWEGNVRELKNVVESNVALSPATVMSADHVRSVLDEDIPSLPSFDQARDAFTRDYLVQLLKITAGNVARAARLAKRNRTDFYKLMQRHGVDRDQVLSD
ncbi:MAG: sigma 54-interacting transcriptional regulator [Gammaproteobacteria bacterium]|nr:sigma 54-interacting transcriptional regulator [Gammaproteobacteria bacterium]